MSIAENTVVQFFYTLKNAEGDVLESTDSDAPMAYLHGHNNIFPKLEAAIEGKTTGDTLTVTLPPADTYGERQVDAVQRVPVKHLQGAKKWRPGMVATVHTDQGVRQVTVLKVGRFMVDVDVNHPFAGQTLTFEIEIGELRAATAEEIDHGHAHGVGGHHH